MAAFSLSLPRTLKGTYLTLHVLPASQVTTLQCTAPHLSTVKEELATVKGPKGVYLRRSNKQAKCPPLCFPLTAMHLAVMDLHALT